MRLHHEILDDKRKQIWRSMSHFKRVGYLAGGTALALQLGHRLSYDFDIFCRRPVTAALIRKITQSFPRGKVLLNNSDEFTFLTADDIKISFIYYPFNLDAYLQRQPTALPLLSIQGIALAKAYALNRRNSWRDYVDLYFIVRDKHMSLKQVVAAADKVYGEAFNEKLFLAQLLYTDDVTPGEIKNIKLLKEKIGLATIKKFFQAKIDEYMR